MADLSQLSNDDLMKIANQKSQASANDAGSSSLAHLSNEDLMKIAGSSTPSNEPWTAGLHGAGNAATFGYLPEIESKLGSKSLDEYRAREQELRTSNPKSYLGGELAGGVGSALIGGEIGGAALGAAKGVPILGRLAGAGAKILGGEATGVGSGLLQGAKTGAAYGALQNPETKPGENLSVGDATTQRLKQGLLGAAGGAVTGGILGRISQSGAKTSEDAAEQAFEALKPKLRDAQMMGDRSGDIGETLLRNKIITGAPQSYSNLADQISSHLDEKGKALGDYIETLATKAEKKAGSSPNLPMDPNAPINFSGNRVGLDKAKLAKAAAQDMDDLSLVPGSQGKVKQIKNVFDDFLDKNDNTIPIRDAQQIKQAIGNAINWKRLPSDDIPAPELALRSLYSKINQGIEDAGEAISKMEGDDSFNKFLELKGDYRNLKDAYKVVSKTQAREQANRHLSLTDYIAGGAASAHGGLLTLPAAYANKFARTFGSQINAGLLSKMGNLTEGAENLAQEFGAAPALSAAQKLGRSSQTYGLLGGRQGAKYAQ